MAEQGYDYDQYAPQTSGRLFSNSMFGFNKEEVLEYLDELADENYQRQEEAELHISELTQTIHNLEANLAGYQQGGYAVAEGADPQQLTQVTEDLEVAKAATQQAEEELAELREQLFNAQQENSWLREEYQKNDEQMANLHRQLDNFTQSQWGDNAEQVQRLNEVEQQLNEARKRLEENDQKLRDAEQRVADNEYKLRDAEQQLTAKERELAARASESQLSFADKMKLESYERKLAESEHRLIEGDRQLTELRAQLKKTAEELEKEKEHPSSPVSSMIISEANAEAERIRAMANEEKERIRRQIRSSAGGLAESITNLRGDVAGVENNVTDVLESVQTALADVLSALTRTEQNLTTLGVQVDRFPAASAPVPKSQPQQQQQVVYFQPTPQPVSAPPRRAPRARAAESFGQGGFRQVTPDDDSKVQPFRASYSGSSSNQNSYWPQAAEAVNGGDSFDDRKRLLAENLVDTLMKMMD